MRVISWNVRRAPATSDAWRVFADLDPDIALLQEVIDIPATIKASFATNFRRATGRSGTLQKFGTAVLTKGQILSDFPFRSEYRWVDHELERFSGNLVSSVVQIGKYDTLNVVSVHSPAWPVDTSAYAEIDVSKVRLQQNPRVWVADILWSALRNANLDDMLWIVGGDLNMSETFDMTFGSGNREFLDRMRSLHLTECLREYNGRLTPTFRNPRNGGVLHQIDHLFVSDALYSTIVSCRTGNEDTIFGESISDHLPIIADFSA